MAQETGTNVARRALQLCAEMEREMAGLYRDFAALHAGDAELAALWLKTAREEDNHAHQFDLALLLKEEIAAAALSPDEAQALLGVARELRRLNALNPPGPVKALRTAIELEERFGTYHVSTVATFGSPKMRELFESMMAADRDHAEALRAVLAARGQGATAG